MTMATGKISEVTIAEDDESFTVRLHDGRVIEIWASGYVQFWDFRTDDSRYMGSIRIPDDPEE